MKYWCEWAWLDDGPRPGVLVEIDGTAITAVTTAATPPPGATRLPGLVLPGLANAHSHAFHRALRGRATGGGTFWTWREQMYAVAGALDPDTYRRLATAVYTEMALAGVTCVGEFHYLHHPPGGGRYDDPNEMSAALAQAAHDAGIRLTLLDTCYLTSGFDAPVEGVQQRFSDGDAQSWAERADRFTVDCARVRLGAAVHSVRAVPAEQIAEVAAWAHRYGAPLHVHLSEQRKENEACLAAHGRTPAQLLADSEALGANTTAVHATHLTDDDLRLLGGSGTGTCLCPTTEADLGDGIGPALELDAAGSPLSLGSDGHSTIDVLAEAHAVEAGQRLSTERRGHFGAGRLLEMATTTGHRALGWLDAGRIAPGQRADLVAVALDGPRLAAVPLAAVPAVARADDVRHVIAHGRGIVRDGEHEHVPDPGRRLRRLVEELL
ncbi:formimidoylglutamate deiminase [Saccharopolyspora sp. NFXS83]|uniref:formimidoylglutamate deiminase n=1 Tax=Saccharopolyspora sp. NFXS83 TaxID=2993560 RepID=UPI00224B9BE3|nr:formimidoylglutamate deiminase [Saccharopolyspora sp. NFXS83]MCX2732195.1 formimidoylglutamate deiminase [Saccharopolyspora sp. NFXS83]